METRLVDSSILDEIAMWYHLRNLDAPPKQCYPSWGVAVSGVAAGFIVATDTAVCSLDGYVSNPLASPQQRDKAIALITGELLEIASLQGFQRIMVFSKEDSIIKRAESLKFSNKGPFTMLVKEI
jgi:hypothetical protein